MNIRTTHFITIRNTIFPTLRCGIISVRSYIISTMRWKNTYNAKTGRNSSRVYAVFDWFCDRIQYSGRTGGEIGYYFQNYEKRRFAGNPWRIWKQSTGIPYIDGYWRLSKIQNAIYKRIKWDAAKNILETEDFPGENVKIPGEILSWNKQEFSHLCRWWDELQDILNKKRKEHLFFWWKCDII